MKLLVTVLGAFLLIFAAGIANAASTVVAIVEGEIPGTEPRDKVVVTLSVSPGEKGGIQFSQCATINGRIETCVWLQDALAFSQESIRSIAASIPNDTVRVLTDSSTEAGEARSFLRTHGELFAAVVDAGAFGKPMEPIRASGVYNAHKIFPYIFWRARTF